MADGADFDLSTIIPDTYKGEDGAYKFDAFKADVDGALSFKAQEAERIAALPKEAKEYAFELPEDHAWPEGFNPDLMKTKDEKGQDVAFDPKALINADDPDIPALQALMKEIGAPKEAMSKVASLFINREIRAVQEGMAKAAAEKTALGPQADARIATVSRSLQARLPGPMAKAVADAITSADALRGLETLLKSSETTTSPAPQTKSLSDLPIGERLLAGLRARDQKRG